MPHAPLKLEDMTNNGIDPAIARDILQYFTTTKTIKDIYFENVAADFSALLRPGLTENDIRTSLMVMNNGRLKHTSATFGAGRFVQRIQNFTKTGNPKQGLIDQMAKRIFAINQYHALLARRDINEEIKEQLRASDKEAVFQKIGEQGKVWLDHQISVLSNPNSNKATISYRMRELGLTDTELNINNIFAENQLEALLKEPSFGGHDEIKKQLRAPDKTKIRTALKELDRAQVSEYISHLTDPNKTKEEIKFAMNKLGLNGDVPAIVDTVFAQNRYQALLTNPLYLGNRSSPARTQLQTKPKADVIEALKKLDAAQWDKALEDLHNGKSVKGTISAAMTALGLDGADPNKVKEIFAQNRFNAMIDNPGALLGAADDAAHLQMLHRPINAVYTALKALDEKGFDDNIKALMDGTKNIAQIGAAMSALGLNGADPEKVKEIFAQNRHQALLVAGGPLGRAGDAAYDQMLNADKVVIRNKLKALTPEQVKEHTDALMDKSKTKNQIITAMDALGLQIDRDKVNSIFAQNRHNALLTEPTFGSNEDAAYELIRSADKNRIRNKLKNLSSKQVSDHIKDLMDSTKSKAEIHVAMDALGFDTAPDNVNKIFAQNRYKALLGTASLGNAGDAAYDQVRAADKVKIQTALQGLDEAQVTDNIAALMDPVKTKDQVKTAMNTLGLEGDNAVKLDEIFAQNRVPAFVTDVGNDGNHAHFAALLTESSKDEDVKNYFNTLKGVYGNKYNDLQWDTLNRAQKDAIKTAIVNHRPFFANERIKAALATLSTYPGDSHPKFMAVISDPRLPPATKQKLVDDPKKLKQLRTATTTQDKIAAVRACGINLAGMDQIPLDDLFEENEQQQMLHSLHNPALANLLLKNKIVLDGQSIAKWNEKILNPPLHYDVFRNNLLDTAGRNGTPLTGVERTKLFTVLDDPANKKAILKQHNRNIDLYNALNDAVGAADIKIYKTLIEIAKKARLTPPEINDLKVKIKTADTYEDLGAKFNTIVSTVNKFKNLEEVLTEEQFNTIKQLSKHERILNNSNAADKVVKDQKERMKTMQDDLRALNDVTYFKPGGNNSALRVEFQRIMSLDAHQWLLTKTEMLAKHQADELIEEFEHIARIADRTILALKEQQRLYLEMLEELPDKDEINSSRLPKTTLTEGPRDRLQKHRDEIDNELREIRKLLHTYQQLQQRLRGDPLAANTNLKKGILQQLHEASEAKPAAAAALGVTATAETVVLDISRKENYLKEAKKDNGRHTVAGTGTSLSGAASPLKTLFGGLDAVEPGKFRTHVTYGQTRASDGKPIITHGDYIEERGPIVTKVTETGKEITQTVTMTLVAFPRDATSTPNPPGTELTPVEQSLLTEAQIKKVTEMAADYLVKFGKVPSKDDPIFLNSDNEREAGLLWAALMELGSAHKKLKFNEKAIEVNSLFFNPGLQGDKYRQICANSPSLNNMKRSIYTFYSEEHGRAKEEKEVKRDITSFYRETITSGKAEEKAFKAMEKYQPKGPQ